LVQFGSILDFYVELLQAILSVIVFTIPS